MQKNVQQFATVKAQSQRTQQQQQDAGSLQARLQMLYPEKYNTMEQVRAVQRPGSSKSVQADLPILQDHLDDVTWEINSIQKQLEETQH